MFDSLRSALTESAERRRGQHRPDSDALASYAARPIALIFRYVRRYAVAHAAVLASVCAAVSCALGAQYAVKNLIDVLGTGRQHPYLIWHAFLVLVALIVADNLMWRVGGWIAARAFVKVSGNIREELFANLTGHAPVYFADKPPGVLSSRITATANALFTAENLLAWNMLPPCLAVGGAIVMIAAVSPAMAGALVLVSGSLGAALYALARRGTSRHHAFAVQAARVEGELIDVLGNMGVVRGFGATFGEHRRFDAVLANETAARQRSLRYLERLRLLHAVVTVMLSAGLLGWTLWLWSTARATTGDVVLVSSLGFTILHGARDLAVAFVDVTQHMARLAEAAATLLQQHAMPQPHNAKNLEVRSGRIDFEHVTFAYPGRRAVLSDFGLHIEPGQRLGLVGLSGAGKTTILALLQRLYDPTRGVVRIDGQDLATVTQSSLCAAIATVPQDVLLLHRTLSENIRYGRPEATPEEVAAALDDASCTEIVEPMPDGLQTVVGDRGVKLSGGQRQRIAIARAILKGAPILLLDEATSSLDSASEQLIQAALARLMRGRTVVAIAHRLSTLQSFDRIVVLNHGRIVDDGPPDVLAARPGLYRDLLARQLRKARPQSVPI
jgi:ATP-binding cassette, subfamily B, bacterial